MSENKIINALIAFIEGRTSEAKEMLRSPEMRVSSSDVQGRLEAALDFRVSRQTIHTIKDVLHRSLRVDPKEEAARLKLKWTTSHEDAFYTGVNYVESLLEEYIEQLDA